LQRRGRPGHLDAGKVLIAGGLDATGALVGAAELYDPSAGTWADTGALAEHRLNGCDVVLASGHVLAIGGATGQSSTEANVVLAMGGALSGANTARAMVFHASSSAWQSVADMAEPRAGFVAATLSTGEVLVAGGAGVTGAALSTAELFHP
jgi:hypothetical protein